MKALLIAILGFTFLNLTPTPKPQSTVTVGLVGDLGLGRYITSISRQKKNFDWPFQEISPWLQKNNFNLANLEGPIIDDCPTGDPYTFIFCADKKFVPYLKQYKFVLNLNNNHIQNFGKKGLTQTQQLLVDDYFYDNFYTKEINHIKFGFLGYDFVTNPRLDKAKIVDQVKSLSPQVDWLIVSIHWGNEYLPQAEKWRMDFAHSLVDAGADIIHGHHPHVWQNAELYQGKLIYYSFGNFIFDQSWSQPTSSSNMVRLTLSKDSILNEEIFPIKIKFNSQPALVP